MIESLLSLEEMQKRPYLAFLWAVLINSVAILLTSNFQSLQGVGFGFFAVLFTIIPSVFFITLLIKNEEKRDEEGENFWDNHGPDLVLLLMFFFGMTISFAAWSFALPDDTFTTQITKINEIRGTGAVTQAGAFSAILSNNLQVMTVSFILSLVFGAGAIFIIVWNASVLGVYIGQISKSFYHIPVVSLGFLPHGIPEIAGYLVAGLAGGILSVAILRKAKMRPVLFDSVKLLLLGVLLLVFAAGVEVYL